MPYVPRKWDLIGDLAKWARTFVNRTADKIEASSRVEHRPGKASPGQPGGSFPESIRAPSFIERKPWGVVMRWFSLTHTFLFYADGTKRQRARLSPGDLTPSEESARAAVEASAARYQREEERRARAGRR